MKDGREGGKKGGGRGGKGEGTEMKEWRWRSHMFESAVLPATSGDWVSLSDQPLLVDDVELAAHFTTLPTVRLIQLPCDVEHSQVMDALPSSSSQICSLL